MTQAGCQPSNDRWDVGAGAAARLCAPLPASGAWRNSLAEVHRLGIGTLELAPAWLTPPWQPGALRELKAEMEQHGLRAAVAALPEPPAPAGLGLWPGDVGGALASLADLGVEAALLPPLPAGPAAPPTEEEVLHRCRDLAALAEDYGLVLLLQNTAHGWPSDGASMGRLLARVGRVVGLGACFDPAAFVARKRHPFLSEFMPGPLKRFIRCLRLRDALFEDGGEVPADRGNAELKELVSALEARGYQGWYALSLAPSLPYAQALEQAYSAAATMLAGL
jgi:sugar phosphate isomerase/epimerase